MSFLPQPGNALVDKRCTCFRAAHHQHTCPPHKQCSWAGRCQAGTTLASNPCTGCCAYWAALGRQRSVCMRTPHLPRHISQVDTPCTTIDHHCHCMYPADTSHSVSVPYCAGIRLEHNYHSVPQRSCPTLHCPFCLVRTQYKRHILCCQVVKRRACTYQQGIACILQALVRRRVCPGDRPRKFDRTKTSVHQIQTCPSHTAALPGNMLHHPVAGMFHLHKARNDQLKIVRRLHQIYQQHKKCTPELPRRPTSLVRRYCTRSCLQIFDTGPHRTRCN